MEGAAGRTVVKCRYLSAGIGFRPEKSIRIVKTIDGVVVARYAGFRQVFAQCPAERIKTPAADLTALIRLRHLADHVVCIGGHERRRKRWVRLLDFRHS